MSIFRRDPVERLSKVNVLVLDGGAKSSALIKSVFSTLGLTNVFIADDGYSGVKIMKEKRIHIIFTDWELKIQNTANKISDTQDNNINPAINGITFVERIRRSSHSPNPFIPIIMMMDAVQGEEVIRARDCGINEILLRPISADEFCERLVSIIDHPRVFITADTYKGPCRRRHQTALPTEMRERRFKEVRLVKSMSRKQYL